jgi:hypothetical protein
MIWYTKSIFDSKSIFVWVIFHKPSSYWVPMTICLEDVRSRFVPCSPFELFLLSFRAFVDTLEGIGSSFVKYSRLKKYSKLAFLVYIQHVHWLVYFQILRMRTTKKIAVWNYPKRVPICTADGKWHQAAPMK